MIRLVFFGPPGAGKGTQAELISEKLGIAHVATGNMLREAVAKGTQLGKQADTYMRAGNLVPDELVIAMLLERLQEKDCHKGWILDGFPRNRAQAAILEKKGIGPSLVFDFQVDEEALIERMSGRLTCQNCGKTYHARFSPPKQANVCDECGKGPLITRKDDTKETFKNRLQVYRKEVASLVDFYRERNVLHAIDADRKVPEICAQILAIIRNSAIGTK